MGNTDSTPNTPDVERLLSALRSERVRCKEFEKVARAALAINDRLERLEQLAQRLVGDQRALRAEVRNALAPVGTLAQEVEDLGAALQQVIRDR